MRVQQLTEGKISQAYPLVQYQRPDVSQDAWHKFTLAHLSRDERGDAGDRGILTTEDDRGYIFAMLTYAMIPDLHHGRALVAQDVIAVTPLDRFNRLAIAAMFQSLEDLAREKQCAVVHTKVSGFSPGGQMEKFFDSLLNNGHEVDHLVLCKTLEWTT